MITLCIRYRIDHNKQQDFEAYARDLCEPIRRCGGALVGYFLPTRYAGPTDQALALIDFPDLGAYERYRAALSADPDAAADLARAESARCIVAEDRAFVRRIV